MPTTIQSVERAARMLRYVADHPGAVATDIAASLGLATPTAHHLLSTLVREGLLQKDASRRYELGAASEHLGMAVSRQLVPARDLQRKIRALADSTGESCFLTAWRADRIRVIAVVEGDHAVRVAGLDIGYSSEIHLRVGAQVMLAHASDDLRDWALADCDFAGRTEKAVRTRAELDAKLETIRETGLARDDEEFRAGVYAISAPIWADGDVRAALSLTAPVGRFRKNEQRYVDELLRCAGI